MVRRRAQRDKKVEPNPAAINRAALLDQRNNGKLVVVRLRDDHHARFSLEDEKQFSVIDCSQDYDGRAAYSDRVAGTYVQNGDPSSMVVRTGFGEVDVPFSAIRHADVYCDYVRYAHRESRPSRKMQPRDISQLLDDVNSGQFLVIGLQDNYHAGFSDENRLVVTHGKAFAHAASSLDGAYVKTRDSNAITLRTGFGEISVSRLMSHHVKVPGAFERYRL